MNWTQRVVADLIVIRDNHPQTGPTAGLDAEALQQHHLHTVAEGIAYGLSGQRLSIAAEYLLRTAGDLEVVCGDVLEEILTSGEPVTVGTAYQTLNVIARSGES